MNDQPMCNCQAWSCTCDGNWAASSGRFCHLHGIPHPSGLLRLWQRFLYRRSTRRAPVRSQQENT